MTVFRCNPWLPRIVLICLLALSPLSPAKAESRKKKIWKVSVAVLSAVTIADIHSSYGRRELNPLLQSPDGRFSHRGISIKMALVGAVAGTQWLLIRKHPEGAGWAAGANFGASAVTGAVIVHNYMLR